MSLSIGPLTAPLARTRCPPASGSMTRMRKVSRVPGPWSADSTRRTLLNDDSPTRFLECAAPTRPAPALARQPAADETAGQGGGDPERQRAGADRRPGPDDPGRVAPRPRPPAPPLEW